MNTAKLGDRVRVQYVATHEDGTPVEFSPGRQVLAFTVGSNEVIPGISVGVVGMARGEQKRLTLLPGDAYGVARPELVKEIPRKRFPAHLNLQVGKVLTGTAASGRRRSVTVVGLGLDTVVVNTNHPLAGAVLELELQLLSLAPSAVDAGGARYDLGGKG